MDTTNIHPIVIIGAGIAGLACAQNLILSGYSVSVLEASDVYGGRIKTLKGIIFDQNRVHQSRS
jgi:uncharacterized protein with NAD-binding domain and iron-sulfur cluster